MSRLAAALTQYQANNNGNCGSDYVCGFVVNYLVEPGATENTFKDPSRKAYNVVTLKDTTKTTYGLSSSSTVRNNSTDDGYNGQNYITIIYNSKCDGENTVVATGASNYSIRYKLEGAGVACLDNQ